MPPQFDPYAEWLGIASLERPVNHYELLGLPLFCDDTAKIQSQAIERSARVRKFQLGRHSAASQKLLTEIATASVCLTSPEKKLAYDRLLREGAAPDPPSREEWRPTTSSFVPSTPQASSEAGKDTPLYPPLPAKPANDGEIPKPILAGLIILPAIVFTGILLHIVVSHLLSGGPEVATAPPPDATRKHQPQFPQPNLPTPSLPSPPPNGFRPPMHFGPPASSLPAPLIAPFGQMQATQSQYEWSIYLDSRTEINAALGMPMMLIPPGTYEMGSPVSETDRGGNEQLHRVRITRPFFISKYEVTQYAFQKVMGVNPSFFAPGGGGQESVREFNTEKFPVENVYWRDAKEFCDRLSKLPDEVQAGRTYRLPTEAEWEYVCRAGTTTRFHVGDRITPAQANIHERGGTAQMSFVEGTFLGRTTMVGAYPPNVFGVCDMHGNVAEWVNDFFEPGLGYYAHSPADDPPGPPTGDRHVVRGLQRSAQRIWAELNARFETIGFRVVCEPAKR